MILYLHAEEWLYLLKIFHFFLPLFYFLILHQITSADIKTARYKITIEKIFFHVCSSVLYVLFVWSITGLIRIFLFWIFSTLNSNNIIKGGYCVDEGINSFVYISPGSKLSNVQWFRERGIFKLRTRGTRTWNLIDYEAGAWEYLEIDRTGWACVELPALAGDIFLIWVLFRAEGLV